MMKQADKHRSRSAEVDNTGFGTQASGRLYNARTGTPNVSKKGVPVLNRYSWYHTLLMMPLPKFLLALFIVYLLLNIGFAALYTLVGYDQLDGLSAGGPFHQFLEVFFFSAQTFTTVGYGRVSPVGHGANFIATFESFIGLLSFGIATGLFYGRFSRPRAYLRFSRNAIIAPFKDGRALMMRMAPYKNNLLSQAQAKVTLAHHVSVDDKKTSHFYTLPLTLHNISALSLSWTLVHVIDSDSPLDFITKENLEASDLEIIVFVEAFDEGFASQVVQRTSYRTHEIIYGAAFNLMYHNIAERQQTVLDFSKLDSYSAVEIP